MTMNSFYNDKMFKFIFDTNIGRKLYHYCLCDDEEFDYSKDNNIFNLFLSVLLLLSYLLLCYIIVLTDVKGLLFALPFLGLLVLVILFDAIFTSIVSKYLRQLKHVVEQNYQIYQVDAVLTNGTVIDSNGNVHRYDKCDILTDIVIVDNCKTHEDHNGTTDIKLDEFFDTKTNKKFIGYILKQYYLPSDFNYAVSNKGVNFIHQCIRNNLLLTSTLIKKYNIEKTKYKYLKRYN